MRILHLFSNWKWTGPAEPALNLAWQQCREHEVLFLSGEPTADMPSRLVPQAERRGVPTRALLHLRKHEHWIRNRQDVRALGQLLTELRPDVVHAHMDNDHRIAARAVAATRVGRLVRTAYDPAGLSRTLRLRSVARTALDGLIVTSEGARRATLRAYGGSEGVLVGGRERPLAVIEGAIDLARFDPARFDAPAERRRRELPPDVLLLGIVARVQGHRRFDLLLRAFARVVREAPQARLVVIGRGTRLDELLLKPVERLGLGDHVLNTGYLADEAYPAMLATLDAGLFLVPGTDGSCRALRELMAMGVPPVVSTRAPLPDIVEHERSGLVAEETEEGLYSSLLRLCADAQERRRLAQGALDAARRRFDLRRQAAEVRAFYERVLARD